MSSRLSGELGVLLDRRFKLAPRATGHPAPMVGRTSELDRLRGLIAAGEDVVVVGVPGVDKTRTLAEVDGPLVFC